MIHLDFDALALVPLRNAFHPLPVLLHVAGVDLLSDDADTDGAAVAQGLALPLPEIALWGMVALHQVAREGRSACELNEHGVALLFALKGDSLLVHSTRRERTVQVPYQQLFATWQDFDHRVRQFLVQTFGRLADHAWWNPRMNAWLQGSWPLAAESATAASMYYLSTAPDAFDRIDAVES